MSIYSFDRCEQFFFIYISEALFSQTLFSIQCKKKKYCRNSKLGFVHCALWIEETFIRVLYVEFYCEFIHFFYVLKNVYNRIEFFTFAKVDYEVAWVGDTVSPISAARHSSVQAWRKSSMNTKKILNVNLVQCQVQIVIKKKWIKFSTKCSIDCLVLSHKSVTQTLLHSISWTLWLPLWLFWDRQDIVGRETIKKDHASALWQKPFN